MKWFKRNSNASSSRQITALLWSIVLKMPVQSQPRCTSGSTSANTHASTAPPTLLFILCLSLKTWGDQLGRKKKKKTNHRTSENLHSLPEKQLSGETGQLNKNFRGARTKGRNYWFNLLRSFDQNNLRNKTFMLVITRIALGKRQISMWKDLPSEGTGEI